MIPTVFLITIIAFVVIQLPPGSWIDNYMAELQQSGDTISQQQIEALERRYGINQPVYVRYFRWVKGWVNLDFGRSFNHNMPVIDLVSERLGFSVVLALSTLVFVYLVSIPVGVYAATRQYSIGDNLATLFGFLGLSIPNFLLALILMYLFYKYFGMSPGGLLSPEYQGAPWTIAKALDFLQHLWIPIIVVGTAGTAGTIRVLRATMLDELGKDYVQTAKAKGLSERRSVYQHALRLAINPILSRVIWELPKIVSGATITATVLSLPVLGRLLLSSLQSQDMYVAGTIILFQSVLVVIGAFISDILLAISDPRIRYD